MLRVHIYRYSHARTGTYIWYSRTLHSIEWCIGRCGEWRAFSRGSSLAGVGALQLVTTIPHTIVTRHTIGVYAMYSELPNAYTRVVQI